HPHNYTLSLHDALPILKRLEETASDHEDNTDNAPPWDLPPVESYDQQEAVQDSWIEPEKIDVPKEDESSKEDEVIVEASEATKRSEEHTSELQSRFDIV